MGGRLAHFAPHWAKITDDKWVLSLVRKGYRIPFLEHPILSPDPVFFQQPLSQHLEEEVASLLSKGAVEEIILECPRYYSRIFLVPKKNGNFRQIIDLSVLNHFVHTQTFKMETQRKVRRHSAKQLGIFIGSDGRLFAYLDKSSVSQIPQIHVERSSVPVQGIPIRPLDKSFRGYTPYECHRDFLKEKGDNSTSLSPRLARSKPKPSKTVGTQTIHFVADQLTKSDHQLRKIRPSSSSSVHFPTDGVSDSYQYRQSTSEQANEDIGDSQNVFSENFCVSQRSPVSLGTTECCSRFCNAGTVTSPAITNISAQSVETADLPYSHQIRMTSEILQYLKWWLQEDLYHQGMPLKIDPPSHTIFTDASLSGWGAHVEPEGLLFHEVWTEDQSQLHINVLEMKAIFLSLSQAVHKVKNSTVLISTDNTTVVPYIRHQGGTHSTELSDEVWSVLNLCLTHNTQLLVKHIPGRFNTLADQMSRVDKPISTE